MWIRFQEVSVTAKVVWIDEAGKRRQQSKKFTQTINPFNKNAWGEEKTASEIRKELRANGETWLREPVDGAVRVVSTRLVG
jgi:hypothetical protein